MEKKEILFMTIIDIFFVMSNLYDNREKSDEQLSNNLHYIYIYIYI